MYTYNNLDMEKNEKIFIAGALIIGLAVGYLFGAQIGKQTAQKDADQKIGDIKESLDMFVPPLPDVLNILGGKITAINGDTFIIEIPSLSDRYPKPGEPMAVETKTIRITDDTAITDTSFDPQTFKNGLPQTKTISASDLKVGDTVSVTVSENAHTEQNLTAVSINRSSGI